MIETLQHIPVGALRALAASLKNGSLSLGITRHALAQIVGSQVAEIQTCFESLAKEGLTPPQMAVVIEAIIDTRAQAADPETLFSLVLSGPEVPGVPTEDTAATVQTLIGNAREEILLIGYAVHNGKRLFDRLAARMREIPALRVTFCLDIARRQGDTSLPSEIVYRFAREFREKHWPWAELPQLYYDPRSLAEVMDQRSSLHAKCVVVDRALALITSANFTEAAQLRNIEAGVLVRHKPLVERIAGYFAGLQASGQLVRCSLER